MVNLARRSRLLLLFFFLFLTPPPVLEPHCLRIDWTDLQQIFSIGRHTGTDDQYDIHFPVAQGGVAMATNFGGDLAKIWHMPPSFIAMALHDWSIAKLMGAFTLAMTPLHWIEFDERRMNLASFLRRFCAVFIAKS